MTLLKIDKRERDTFHRICIEHNIPVNFYTMEENESMLLAQVDTDSQSVCFHLGRSIELALQIESFKNKPVL